MPKKRISLRIDEDEVAVIGPKDWWEHLVTIYEALADWYPSFEAEYLDRAEWVREYLAKADAALGEDAR